MILVTVELSRSQMPAITLDQVETLRWPHTLIAISTETERTLLGNDRSELEIDAPRLPAHPVTLLRQARIQGQATAVLALSPLFDTDQGPAIATSLHVTLPGLRAVDPLQFQHNLSLNTAQLSARSASISAPAPQVAARQALASVRVTQVGMARISAASLIQAGL